MRALALLLTAATIAAAADPSTARAVIQASAQRKPAPEFALQDSTGKTTELKTFHGKVVLLDFWATWCHGCKLEIPWFADFARQYGEQGLAVVGISMDEGGWNVLKPFLAQTHIPYLILLGNDATAQRYGIETMPDTFLIDRDGRIAAAYRGALVDRQDIEANIKTLLSGH